MRKVLFLLLSASVVFSSTGLCQKVKKADVAGSFYPRDSKELDQTVSSFLEAAPKAPVSGEILGIISPHAGYIFSGSVAGYGFKALKNEDFDVIVLLGPSHKYLFSGVSIYPSGSFQTPLGNLPVDGDIAKKLSLLECVSLEEKYFSGEHSLEVQLPFLFKTFGPIKIVPIVFGDITYDQMGELVSALVKLSKEKKIAIIASSDLSHFHKYNDAKKIDVDTIELIGAQDAQTLWRQRSYAGGRACGLVPIVTLLRYVNAKGGEIKILKYANSGDVSSEKNKVVGYLSALACAKMEDNMDEYSLSDNEKQILINIARTTLQAHLRGKKIPKFESITGNITQKRGAFVTLNKDGQLRGCIGRIVADIPLYEVISKQAIDAALNDSRFPRVTFEELEDIEIEISVLTPFTKVKDIEEIKVGKHGLMIRKGFSSGLLLPQVPIEWGWEREAFLEHTCQKAGLPPTAYKSSDADLYKFSAIVFGENDSE
ncbi:MAG: AmmeMemoRadiSam system protein B [Candidatus Omnitrophica bacterium]|nr:AmmeMemoRadiSam system protein B [Candidatus Omnitrophota bacterium]